MVDYNLQSLAKRFAGLSDDGLCDEQNIQSMDEWVRQFELSKEGDAVQLARIIERLIYDNKTYFARERELLQVYEGYLRRIKLVALPFLDDGNIFDFFKKNLLGSIGERLDTGVDINERVRFLLLIRKDSLFHNRNLSLALAETMRKNEEVLGEDDIKIVGSNEIFRPYIKNWLLDYEGTIQTGGERGGVERISYINNSQNTRKLSEREKEILLRILELYDFLKFSFVIPDSWLEKETGVGGDKIKAEKESKYENAQAQEKIDNQFTLDKVFGNFLNTKFVVDILNSKNKLTGSDVKTLRNDFYQAVNAGNREEAVAALFLMAEMGKLGEAFGGDERFVKFWGDYLAKNNPTEREEFVNDPANAKDLARFLQYILEARLKMKSDETAMIGVLMSNAAREAHDLDYETLAYGDMESGEFRWNV